MKDIEITIQYTSYDSHFRSEARPFYPKYSLNYNVIQRRFYAGKKTIGVYMLYSIKNDVIVEMTNHKKNGDFKNTFTVWRCNGINSRIVNYKNNKKHGKTIVRFRHDILESLTHYKNDKNHGLYHTWYSNGVPCKKNIYDNDSLLKFKDYDKDGNIIKEYGYDEDDEIDEV